MAQRKNRKAKRKVIVTSTAYEAFKGFCADKTSKIFLKYVKERYPKGFRAKDKQAFEKFLLGFTEWLKNSTSEERYLADLFIRFVEIDSSLENLKSAPLYLSNFPKLKSFSKAGVTERQYIIYHIENYLQESYILKERMKRFLRFLSRKLRKNGQAELSNSVNKCIELFEGGISNTIKIRGHHVHERRYIDEGLWTLTVFDHNRKMEEVLEFGYQHLLFLTKAKWLKWVEKQNVFLISIIDEIFKLVNFCVFEKQKRYGGGGDEWRSG